MKKRICFVVAWMTTAESFLRDHIKALNKDYDVYLVGCVQEGDDMSLYSLTGYHHLEIRRNISIWHDLWTIWQLYRYFHTMKFDAVHSITPKAGLVTALAGWLAGVKHRTHIFTGQVWATCTGMMRWLLKSIDKVIARLNNHILVDGKSQRTFLEKEGVLRKGQALVFGSGSISGVHIPRFTPNSDIRNEMRITMGIREDVLCFIFLGRFHHDKGISELFDAYNRLASEEPNVFLLMVGRDEGDYLNTLQDYSHITEGKNFHFYGYTTEPEKCLNAADVYTLPTYREGFGTSVLEAACMGVPCITTDAYGVLDAYVVGETGLQCHVGDSESLYQCMRIMYDHPEMIKKMGKRARQRVIDEFSNERITNYWVEFYRQILG